MSVRQNIKVAIAGVGNCASALVQGVEYYRDRQGGDLDGIMRHSIGGYRCGDIEFVAAFDVDRRKVGRPLEEAIFAKPNCTHIFQSALPVSNVIVQAGPVLDGVAAHMADYPDDAAFRPVDLEPTDIAAALRSSGAEVLVCYLPVGLASIALISSTPGAIPTSSTCSSGIASSRKKSPRLNPFNRSSTNGSTRGISILDRPITCHGSETTRSASSVSRVAASEGRRLNWRCDYRSRIRQTAPASSSMRSAA